MADDVNKPSGKKPRVRSAQLEPQEIEALCQPAEGSTGIEDLLHRAEAALASITTDAVPSLAPFPFEEFGGLAEQEDGDASPREAEVQLDLEIELGRTEIPRGEILKLRPGTVLSLDKNIADPVDIYVSGKIVARGDVLMLNENVCVRVTELVSDRNETP